MTSTEDELATDIAAILADSKDIAGGAAAVTAYLMPIIAVEADFAARTARAYERAELIRISGNWAIDPELTDAERDILSAFQDEIWRRVRGQGQAEAAAE